MKQAILITAYKDTSSVYELVKVFGEDFNFYVHFDKKSQLDVTSLKSITNLTIINSYKVNWGGTNHFFAILDLCKAALENKDNVFFHLITAEDFPIKSLSDFWQLDIGKNYLDYTEFPYYGWDSSGGFDRINYYRFFDLFNAKKKNGARILNFLLNLQKKIGLKRKSLNFDKLYGGSTYWSLNRESLEKVFSVLDYKMLRRLRYTFCAEEFVFQSIIMNSALKHTVVNNNLRYIDWQSKRGGDPAFLDETDFDNLKNCDKLFARKILKTDKNQLLIALKSHIGYTE
ncbi:MULTISPECIES: beta-1,6-N-acetylglucosaminyltransferase [Sphingobacterium]|uniref:beta-1,6-N-acetylglucosaminyltransferase n=1 Tax=Sphingobacterium TaxID=28453 RepID=UPI0030181EB3